MALADGDTNLFDTLVLYLAGRAEEMKRKR